MKACKYKACGKAIEEEYYRNIERHFCGTKCKNKYFVDKRRKKIKQMALDYKGSKCSICGYQKSVYALIFHHLDPSKKDFNISKNGHSRSWDRVRTE